MRAIRALFASPDEADVQRSSPASDPKPPNAGLLWRFGGTRATTRPCNQKTLPCQWAALSPLAAAGRREPQTGTERLADP